MSTIVEATSLSAVTSIATNPPPHPKDLPDLPQLPLVLYIARVPGSRDVFLTPLKPREKVVTAEDVQSSLYFIHVHGDDDVGEISRDPVSSANADASELVSMPGTGITRKPVLPRRPVAPPTPPYPVDDENVLETPNRSPSPQRSRHIARKPLGLDASNGNHRPLLDLPVLARRPLPSPPRDEQPFEQYEGSSPTSRMHLLRRSEQGENVNPSLRRQDHLKIPPDEVDAHQPGSLTLIRRDPSTNEQWNVACIHDPPILEVSSAALRNPSAAKRIKRGGAPVYLNISNPAYAQFIDRDRAASRISTASSNSSDSDQPPEGIFRRRLHMPGSRFGEHAYSYSSRTSSELEASGDSSMRRTIRSSADLRGSSSAAPAIDDRQGKGYTFASPWDGRCEFTTGNTGKSLKCRHYLPLHEQTGASLTESVVSELRFNLPTSNKTATVVKEKRSSYIRGIHRRQDSFQDHEDYMFGDDGKMNLALGQERAGGGFGGKQAKLGKLIIEPEGLKMLDLLVAANVALWWRAYERY